MKEPQRFRKKSIEILAMQWEGGLEDASDVIYWVIGNGGTAGYHEENAQCTCTPPVGSDYIESEHILIKTLEGYHSALPGDWVIQGLKGEFYPHKGDFFFEAYDPA